MGRIVFPVYTYLILNSSCRLFPKWDQKSFVQPLYKTQTSIRFAGQIFRRWLRLLFIVRQWFCSCSLFNVPLIVCGDSLFGPCCVMHYFESIILARRRAPVALL